MTLHRLPLLLAAGLCALGVAAAQTRAAPTAASTAAPAAATANATTTAATAFPIGPSGAGNAVAAATPSASPSAPAQAATGAAPATDAPSTGAVTAAATPTPAAAPAALDGRVQDLKADVIRLNRDLLVLEEELLFPASTQVALFVSMDVGKLFELESVQIKLNDKIVASHLYTPLEVQALHRGGMQRVYIGNLKAGEQRVDAFFTGRGPHERDYKRGATLTFDKSTEPKYIELRISDRLGKLQPEFEVKVW